MAEETKPLLTEFRLTNEEALLLDGKVRPVVQALIDRIKSAQAIAALAGSLGEREAAMVAKIVETARANGRLSYATRSIQRCPCCGRSEGYHVHKRSGKYHTKGRPNLDAPVMFTGYDMDRGFGGVQGHISVGCCERCLPVIKDALVEALTLVRAEIPKAITGHAPRYKRCDNRKCKQCGWEGHEGQMTRRSTIMADGTYAAGCPSCGAENILFRTVVEAAKGFTVIDTPPEAPEAPPAPPRLPSAPPARNG